MFVKKKTEKDLKNKPRILFSPHVCPPCHVTSPITQSMCLSWWKQNEPQRVINYQMQKWNGVGSVLVVTSEVSFLQVPHCFCHEAICLFPAKYWRSTWFTYMWWSFFHYWLGWTKIVDFWHQFWGWMGNFSDICRNHEELEIVSTVLTQKCFHSCSLQMMSSLPAGWSKSIRSPSRPFATAVAVVVVVFLLVVVVVVSRLKLLDPGGHTLPPVHLLLPHPRPPISLFTFVTFALEKTQNLSTKADSSSHRKNWGKWNLGSNGLHRHSVRGSGANGELSRWRRRSVCRAAFPSSPNVVVRSTPDQSITVGPIDLEWSSA